jgi:hypothetical protein
MPAWAATTAAWAATTAAWVVKPESRKVERQAAAWAERAARLRAAVRAARDRVALELAAWLVAVWRVEAWRAEAWLALQSLAVLSRRAIPRHPKSSLAYCPARRKYLRLRRPERASPLQSSTPLKIS